MKNNIIPNETTLRMQFMCGREIYCRIRYHHDSKEEDVRLFWSNYHHCVGVDHLPGPGRYSMSFIYEEDFPFDILYIEGSKTIARIRWNENGAVEEVHLIYDKGGYGVTVVHPGKDDEATTYDMRHLPFKVLSWVPLEE